MTEIKDTCFVLISDSCQLNVSIDCTRFLNFIIGHITNGLRTYNSSLDHRITPHNSKIISKIDLLQYINESLLVEYLSSIKCS